MFSFKILFQGHIISHSLFRTFNNLKFRIEQQQEGMVTSGKTVGLLGWDWCTGRTGLANRTVRLQESGISWAQTDLWRGVSGRAHYPNVSKKFKEMLMWVLSRTWGRWTVLVPEHVQKMIELLEHFNDKTVIMSKKGHRQNNTLTSEIKKYWIIWKYQDCVMSDVLYYYLSCFFSLIDRII